MHTGSQWDTENVPKRSNSRDGIRSKQSGRSIGPTETSPLLHRPRLITDIPDNATWTSRRVVAAVLGAVLLQCLGDQLEENPRTRIIEAIICYQHYERMDPSKILLGRKLIGHGALGGVDEALCKIDDVQAKLATLAAYQQFFDGLPGLVLAIPFGFFLDRRGRKPLLVLALLAAFLSSAWTQSVLWWWKDFGDLRWIWFSTTFAAVGGGSAMLSSMLLVTLNDVTPSAKRAAVFLRVASVELIPAVIMPPLAAGLMSLSAWIPCFLGLMLQFLAVLLYLRVPETLDFRSDASPRPSTPPPQPVLPPCSCSTHACTPAKHKYYRRLVTTLSRRWVQLRNETSFLFHDWRIPVLTTLYISHELIASAGPTLLQYVSKRFNMILAESTLLITTMSAVKVILLLYLLPWVSRKLQQPSSTSARTLGLSPKAKDLWLARITALSMAIGWTTIGLAPTPEFACLGMVFAAASPPAFLFIRSYLTALTPAHHVARIYSVIALFDTIGSMMGGAIVADLFERGMDFGLRIPFGMGLPWYFFGILGFVTATTLFIISSKDRVGDLDRLGIKDMVTETSHRGMHQRQQAALQGDDCAV